MIVAFDSRPGSEPNGIGRYTSCLLQALKATAGDKNELRETHRPRQADLFHAPWLHGAMLRSPCPMVVTIHDLIALKRPSECLRMGARTQLRFLAAQRAVRLIVPTHCVAADVAERLDVEWERIAVIPEAAAPSMYARNDHQVSDVRSALGLPERYLVWVGNMSHPQRRRHLARLTAVARRLPLVLVGPTRPWAHELPGVIVTGQVSDDQLAAVYSGAQCLLMSSEEEGFGLAGIEALACGTPVVAFDQPVLREVLGDRATLVSSSQLTELVEAAEASRRPAPPPTAWGWLDAAEQTWRVYDAALAEARAGTTRAVGPSRLTPRRLRIGTRAYASTAHLKRERIASTSALSDQ